MAQLYSEWLDQDLKNIIFSQKLHESLDEKLASVNWDIKMDIVQQFWNVFESLLFNYLFIINLHQYNLLFWFEALSF